MNSGISSTPHAAFSWTQLEAALADFYLIRLTVSPDWRVKDVPRMVVCSLTIDTRDGLPSVFLTSKRRSFSRGGARYRAATFRVEIFAAGFNEQAQIGLP